MTLIDIEQELQFVYYDDNSKQWKQKTSTIADMLKLFSAYQYLKVIDINEVKWGLLEHYGRSNKK